VQPYRGVKQKTVSGTVLSSEVQTIVGMSKAASSRNCVLCGTMVVTGLLQISITLGVDEKLERGSAYSIFQIVGEEVDPGERQ
jgi:hypothetical protein